MPTTGLADIIIPTEFENYVIERTATKSDFFQSGIVEMSQEFDALAQGGGHEVKMPYWKDLSQARQTDLTNLSTNKITADQDISRIQNDGQVWSVNHLAKAVSGDDPLQAIIDLVADYWARIDQGILVSSLKGIFGAASMSGNLLSIKSESIAGQSSATRLNGATFVDATQKLGDRGDRLTAIAMHSATEAALRKLDLIDFVPDSEGKPTIKTFQGRGVIVDDGCPVRAGATDGLVYTSYLFGPGAFGKGSSKLAGTPLEGGFGTEGVELARVPLQSDTLLINRRRFILHPRGVKFTSASVAGATPTNTEMENQANWVRVWENKNVRLIAIEHN